MHIRSLVIMVAVLLLTLASATPALAQAPPVTFEFGGLTGVTLRNKVASMFGARGGVRVRRDVVVFGEVGRLGNVMTGDLQDILDGALDPDNIEADDFEFSVTLPARYVFGGARLEIPRGGRVTPYVEGGLGFTSLKMSVTLIVEDTDFSDEFEELLEEEGLDLSFTEALLVFGGGVRYPVTPRVAVDVGARVFRVLSADHITKPSIYASVVWTPR